MITQKNLALELGLTDAAVSMALRNHPRVSEATRRRVQALAKKRGYTVNPAFSRRASQNRKSRNGRMPLALVISGNPRFSRGVDAYEEGVKQHASEYGYALTKYLISPELPARRLGQILYNRGVEAVIIGPISDPSVLRDFPWKMFSVIGCEAGRVAPPCHLVMPDIGSAIMEARDRCLDAGCKRIGLALIPEPSPPVDHLDRCGAEALCLKESGRNHTFFSESFGAEEGARFQSWVRKCRLDAVIGQTPTFYWKLLEMGLSVPADLGYLDLHLDAHRSEKDLSGFEEDHLHTAALACQLLDGQVRRFERGAPRIPARLLVKMTWHEGRTLLKRT